MRRAPLKPTLKLILSLYLALATAARAQEAEWPIHTAAVPQMVQAFAEFGDASKTKYHTGVDLGVPLGTSVFPLVEGTVVLIQLLSATADHGFGRTVVMRHIDSRTGKTTFYSQYSHLSEIDAKLMEACKPKRAAGEVTLACTPGVARTTKDSIGKSGGSGFGVDGRWPNHLHIEMKSFGTLCTFDTAGTVCGYSTAQPSTIGYLDPIDWLFWVKPFPGPTPVTVTDTGVAARFMPDAGQGQRPITALSSTDARGPLQAIAWTNSGCDEGSIRVRRVAGPNCSGPSGASACFQDTRDPELKPPDRHLGLLPTAWICAKYLTPLAVPTARQAVTEGVLLSGGSVSVKRVGGDGLSVEVGDRDGLFAVYEAPQVGSGAATDTWNLIFLSMVYEAPPFKAFAATHKNLTDTLLASYGAPCAGASTPKDQAACVVAGLAKARRIGMGGGRYDEGYRCVVWSNRPHDGADGCKPY